MNNKFVLILFIPMLYGCNAPLPKPVDTPPAKEGEIDNVEFINNSTLTLHIFAAYRLIDQSISCEKLRNRGILKPNDRLLIEIPNGQILWVRFASKLGANGCENIKFDPPELTGSSTGKITPIIIPP